MDPIIAYHSLTQTIMVATGISADGLHLNFGLGIYLLAQVILGTRRGSKTALLITLHVELANEIMNRLYWGSWRLEDTLTDILITMAWPTAITLVSTFRRRRWEIKEHIRRMEAREQATMLGRNDAIPAHAHSR